MKKLSRVARYIFFEEYIFPLLLEDDTIEDLIAEAQHELSKTDSSNEFYPRLEEILSFLQEWLRSNDVGRVRLWNKHLHRSCR